MKFTHSPFLSALLLGSCILLPAIASAAPNIQLVVPSFDYRADGVKDTIGEAIANNGTIAGNVTAPIATGFLRSADGTFSPLFTYQGSNTYVRGVNSSNVVAGSYLTSGQIEHGFFFDGATFTQYDVPGAVNTRVTGINDAGGGSAALPTYTHWVCRL